MPIQKLSFLKSALHHKCPACGQGYIYGKLLEVKSRCDVCSFRLKEHDAGDGPAFFAMFIAGIIITALALLVEIYLMIPLWLHIILWIPITIALSILLLKIIKSLLITLQYRNNVGNFKDEK